MNAYEERLLATIEAWARHEAELLASQFARSAAEEREAILAGLEFERWLADSCQHARSSG